MKCMMDKMVYLMITFNHSSYTKRTNKYQLPLPGYNMIYSTVVLSNLSDTTLFISYNSEKM